MAILKNKSKMTKFSQKHAQYAFWRKLKHKIAIKFEEKAIKKQKSAKTSPKNKQISVKTSPKTRTRKSSKNPQLQKKQAQIRGKTTRLATLMASWAMSEMSVLSSTATENETNDLILFFSWLSKFVEMSEILSATVFLVRQILAKTLASQNTWFLQP